MAKKIEHIRKEEVENLILKHQFKTNGYVYSLQEEIIMLTNKISELVDAVNLLNKEKEKEKK